MLNKLSTDNDQDHDEEYSSLDSDDYICDYTSMQLHQEKKEISQFIDNLSKFTPLLYQFTPPEYPKQRMGFYSCTNHYTQWHHEIFNIDKESKPHELSSKKHLISILA